MRLARAMPYDNSIKIKYKRQYQWVALMVDIEKAYNNAYNRSIGMTPNQAALDDNRQRVLEHREKYFSTFKYQHKKLRNKYAYNKGDKV